MPSCALSEHGMDTMTNGHTETPRHVSDSLRWDGGLKNLRSPFVRLGYMGSGHPDHAGTASTLGLGLRTPCDRSSGMRP